MPLSTLRIRSVNGLAAILALVACSHEPPSAKAMYTVDEYLAKPDVMATKLHECANNPGELRTTPDCVNVKEAVKRQGIGSLDKLRPLKLSTPGAATAQPDEGSQHSR